MGELEDGQALLERRREQMRLRHWQTLMASDGSELAERTRDLLVDDHCSVCGCVGRFLKDSNHRVCTDCARAAADEKWRKGMVQRRLRTADLLDGEPAHMHLDSFVRDKPFQRRAYNVVMGWLTDWGAYMQESPLEGFRDSVLLWSKAPGTGKTHLARAVQRYVIINGGVAVFEMMSDLLDKIRQSYDDPELPTFTVTTRLRESDLLILDDLGKEYVSQRSKPWVRNILWGAIDYRHRKGKPMFVTSNLSPQEVSEAFGRYGASRFNEMVDTRIVDMSGEDWRMRI
jgi:DNA replication protein DnaC